MPACVPIYRTITYELMFERMKCFNVDILHDIADDDEDEWIQSKGPNVN